MYATSFAHTTLTYTHTHDTHRHFFLLSLSPLSLISSFSNYFHSWLLSTSIHFCCTVSLPLMLLRCWSIWFGTPILHWNTKIHNKMSKHIDEFYYVFGRTCDFNFAQQVLSGVKSVESAPCSGKMSKSVVYVIPCGGLGFVCAVEHVTCIICLLLLCALFSLSCYAFIIPLCESVDLYVMVCIVYMICVCVCVYMRKVPMN